LAVAGYLAAKFRIPAYRIFTVGLGPDQPVAENKSKSGRAKNRRVDVALFTSAPATQANEEPAQSAAIK
jgi:outer membrane protein OmpA-like peptidoglycan-associated protein